MEGFNLIIGTRDEIVTQLNDLRKKHNTTVIAGITSTQGGLTVIAECTDI
tara:strand:+ start:10092 stop:10241 length:150 start_codon:yes stop_codon:yes gene_type:complete